MFPACAKAHRAVRFVLEALYQNQTVDPAPLEFDDRVPVSTIYGDVYHSASGAPAQARGTSSSRATLPSRWQGKARFTILETGLAWASIS